MRMRFNLLALIYVAIGVAVAANYDYFERLGTIRGIISAILAVILWPLVLLGVDLSIRR